MSVPSHKVVRFPVDIWAVFGLPGVYREVNDDLLSSCKAEAFNGNDKLPCKTVVFKFQWVL